MSLLTVTPLIITYSHPLIRKYAKKCGPPKCKRSAATPRAHLVREKFSREGVRDRANPETKEDPIGHNQDHWQVVEVWMVCGQLKIVVEAQEDHVDSNDETPNSKLGTSVDPRHDER